MTHTPSQNERFFRLAFRTTALIEGISWLGMLTALAIKYPLHGSPLPVTIWGVGARNRMDRLRPRLRRRRHPLPLDLVGTPHRHHRLDAPVPHRPLRPLDGKNRATLDSEPTCQPRTNNGSSPPHQGRGIKRRFYEMISTAFNRVLRKDSLR